MTRNATLKYYFLLHLLAYSNKKSKHTTMASSVQTDIDLFLKDQENKNPSLKTKRDVRYISRYFLSLGESRDIVTIPPHELNCSCFKISDEYQKARWR